MSVVINAEQSYGVLVCRIESLVKIGFAAINLNLFGS